MTAHDLISDIFRRTGCWNVGLPGNTRRITRPQLELLRRLIAEDEQGSAMQSNGPGIAVWEPSGRDKYVITEDLRGDRHTLTHMTRLAPSGMEMLF